MRTPSRLGYGGPFVASKYCESTMHPVYHAKITVSTKNFPRSEDRKCGVKGLMDSANIQWRKGCPCRKLKLEHIDGVARPRSAPKELGQLPAPAAARVRPCARTSAYEPRYNISDTNEADGEDAVRQRPPYGQDSPAGSSRSASPRMRSAMASAPRPVGLECP